MTEASLIKASLLSTQMPRAKLGGTDLSGARITGDLSGASLIGAKLAGADLSVDMRNQSMGPIRGVLKPADLMARADLYTANFADADFTETDLESTLLPSAAALAEARNLDKAWNLTLARRHHDGWHPDRTLTQPGRSSGGLP